MYIEAGRPQGTNDQGNVRQRLPAADYEDPQLSLRVRSAWRETMKSIDKINKQKNLCLTLVAIGFAAMFVLAFTEKYIPNRIFNPILYSALALFGVGNILLYIGIRCPKCNKIIGYAIVFSAKKVDRCPRCRVIFDENILE